MTYTVDSWLYVVSPYPTLSKDLGNLFLINDIINTKVPDVVFGCFHAKDPLEFYLKEYLCYFDKDENLIFDDDSTVITLFRHSVLDPVSQKVIGNRYENKFK